MLVSELKYNSCNPVQSENDTYELIKKSSSEIVNSHKAALSEYDHPLKEDINCLPSIYWIPKMHKTPVGERFIIASPKYNLKPLLKDITSVLKVFQKQIESFHDKNRVWVGASNFWIIRITNQL